MHYHHCLKFLDEYLHCVCVRYCSIWWEIARDELLSKREISYFCNPALRRDNSVSHRGERLLFDQESTQWAYTMRARLEILYHVYVRDWPQQACFCSTYMYVIDRLRVNVIWMILTFICVATDSLTPFFSIQQYRGKCGNLGVLSGEKKYPVIINLSNSLETIVY